MLFPQIRIAGSQTGRRLSKIIFCSQFWRIKIIRVYFPNLAPKSPNVPSYFYLKSSHVEFVELNLVATDKVLLHLQERRGLQITQHLKFQLQLVHLYNVLLLIIKKMRNFLNIIVLLQHNNYQILYVL
mgnify:CR=1 FL=1